MGDGAVTGYAIGRSNGQFPGCRKSDDGMIKVMMVVIGAGGTEKGTAMETQIVMLRYLPGLETTDGEWPVLGITSLSSCYKTARLQVVGLSTHAV